MPRAPRRRATSRSRRSSGDASARRRPTTWPIRCSPAFTPATRNVSRCARCSRGWSTPSSDRAACFARFARCTCEPTPQGAFVSLPGGVRSSWTRSSARCRRAPCCCRHASPSFAQRRLRRSRPAPVGRRRAASSWPCPPTSPAGCCASFDTSLASLCEATPYASTATVAFGYRREQIGHPHERQRLRRSARRAQRAARRHLGHVEVAGTRAGRTRAAARLSRRRTRPASPRAIGRRADRATRARSCRELLRDLRRAAFSRLYRWTRQSPQYEVGHLQRLARIEQRLAAIPGLFTTGSGFRAIGIPDCITDGRETAAAPRRLSVGRIGDDARGHGLESTSHFDSSGTRTVAGVVVVTVHRASHREHRLRIRDLIRMKPVHVIGVPLDLGGGRRGVDMGPSAFRIAGLGDRSPRSAATRRRPRRPPGPDSRNAARRRFHQEVHPRDRARLPISCYDQVLESLRSGRRPARARRRSQPRRRIGRGQRRLGARTVVAAARPDLGRRARRHEHAGDDRPAATCTACRSPRCSGRSRASSRRSGRRRRCCREHTVLVGIRNLDEREKSAIRESGVHVFTMKDIDREGIASVAERAHRARRERHRRHSRLVRHGRLRSVDRAGRRHAGQGRPRLPRGAH